MSRPSRQSPTVARIVMPILALLLSGCGGMFTSDAPAERVYWLEPLNVPAIDSPTTRAVAGRSTLALGVEAAPGLDTDRLLILENDARLNEYAAARWAGRAPEVVQSSLKASLEAGAPFSRIADRAGAVAPDALLALELRRFFVQGRSVQIELQGDLSCRESVHTVSARGTAAVTEQRLGSVVAAFQRALDEVAASVVRAVTDARCF